MTPDLKKAAERNYSAVDSLYTSDVFRMYCFKVLPCTKKHNHNWKTCPFSHEGEKAARRDPRKFRYVGIECPEAKPETGECPRGDYCPYAHNVFEFWLHPTRYRTQLCNEPATCKRRVCFFAHCLTELREPSLEAEAADRGTRAPCGGHRPSPCPEETANNTNCSRKQLEAIKSLSFKSSELSLSNSSEAESMLPCNLPLHCFSNSDCCSFANCTPQLDTTTTGLSSTLSKSMNSAQFLFDYGKEQQSMAESASPSPLPPPLDLLSDSVDFPSDSYHEMVGYPRGIPSLGILSHISKFTNEGCGATFPFGVKSDIPFFDFTSRQPYQGLSVFNTYF